MTTTEFVEIEDMVMPSVETIQATYKALTTSINNITSESKAVLDTVTLVCDILNTVSGSTDLRTVFGALGVFAVPVPVVMKGIFTASNKYIERRTGISLKSWTSLVNTTKAEFEEYLAQLAKAAERCQESDEILETQEKLDSEQLREAQDLLENTRLKTRLWRQVMARMIETIEWRELVDSMLEAKEPEVDQEQEEVDQEQEVKSESGRLSQFRRRVVQGMEKVRDATSEQRERLLEQRERLLGLVLSRVDRLKKRVDQLDDQVGKLSDWILELEDLLDLEIAQIKATLGEIPSHEVRILGTRIAVTIFIPRLTDQIGEAKRDIDFYQSFLQKLDSAHKEGKVEDRIYENLAAEYQADLDATEAKLSAVRKEANEWKTRRSPALEMGVNWLKEELETTQVRELVGELKEKEAEQRVKTLKREIDRFKKANELLASL